MNRLIPYYRARYYSPNIGRFISRDPLKNAMLQQGPNLYWYVRNNAVNAMDPMGLACCCPAEDQACVDAINAAVATVNDVLNDWSEMQLFKELLADITNELGNTPFDYAKEELISTLAQSAADVELGPGAILECKM